MMEKTVKMEEERVRKEEQPIKSILKKPNATPTETFVVEKVVEKNPMVVPLIKEK